MKDGGYRIVITLSQNKDRRSIPTPFVVYKNQIRKRNNTISDIPLLIEVLKFEEEIKDIYKSFGTMCVTMSTQEAKDSILNVLEKNKIKALSKTGIDIIAHIKAVAKTKTKSTAEIYIRLANLLVNFTKKDVLNTADVTYQFLTDFEKVFKGTRSKNQRMVLFKACFNDAIKKYNNEDKIIIKYNPFTKYTIPKDAIPPPPEPLEEKQVYEIFSYKHSCNRDELAQDMFILGLTTCGINTVDIYNLLDIYPDKIVYNRQKTESRRSDNALMSIEKNRFSSKILSKYSTPKNRLSVFFQYSDHHNFNKAVNKGLKIIGKKIGVANLYYYQSRDTFASWSRNKLNISRDDIYFYL